MSMKKEYEYSFLQLIPVSTVMVAKDINIPRTKLNAIKGFVLKGFTQGSENKQRKITIV